MVPGDSLSSMAEFLDNVPPSFNGRDNYASYHEDVLLLEKLAELASARQGPALVGRLSSEGKASAKYIPLDEIGTKDGVELLLRRLDKSYAIDDINQLDVDFENFLDFTWKR